MNLEVHGYPHRNTAIAILSVHPSVRLSVCLKYFGIVSKQLKISLQFFHRAWYPRHSAVLRDECRYPQPEPYTSGVQESEKLQKLLSILTMLDCHITCQVLSMTATSTSSRPAFT